MQNFQRISSKKPYTEFSVCVNISALFITRFCSDEERTWFALLEWTFLNVIEKAKYRAMILQLLDETATSNVMH